MTIMFDTTVGVLISYVFLGCANQFFMWQGQEVSYSMKVIDKILEICLRKLLQNDRSTASWRKGKEESRN